MVSLNRYFGTNTVRRGPVCGYPPFCLLAQPFDALGMEGTGKASRPARAKMTRGTSRKFLEQHLPLCVGKPPAEEEGVEPVTAGGEVAREGEYGRVKKPKTPKECSKADRSKMTRGTQRKFLVQNLPLGIGKLDKDPQARPPEEAEPAPVNHSLKQTNSKDNADRKQADDEPAPAPARTSYRLKPKTPKEHIGDKRVQMTRGTQRNFLKQNLPLGIGQNAEISQDGSTGDMSAASTDSGVEESRFPHVNDAERQQRRAQLLKWGSTPEITTVGKLQVREDLRGNVPAAQRGQSLPNLGAKAAKEGVSCKVYTASGLFSKKCVNCGEAKRHSCHAQEHTCTICYLAYTALSNAAKPCRAHCGEVIVVGQAALDAKRTKRLPKRLDELQSRGMTIFAWSCCPEQAEACGSVQRFRDLQVPHKGHHQ
eukprot:1892509-Rhodomonas_salina.1